MNEQVIYKYPFPVDENFKIVFPKDAIILCAQIQHGTPCMWAIVNPDGEIVTREFTVMGTGHKRDDIDSLNYIDTFQLEGGSLIWHLFEVISND